MQQVYIQVRSRQEHKIKENQKADLLLTIDQNLQVTNQAEAPINPIGFAGVGRRSIYVCCIYMCVCVRDCVCIICCTCINVHDKLWSHDITCVCMHMHLGIASSQAKPSSWRMVAQQALHVCQGWKDQLHLVPSSKWVWTAWMEYLTECHVQWSHCRTKHHNWC